MNTLVSKLNKLEKQKKTVAAEGSDGAIKKRNDDVYEQAFENVLAHIRGRLRLLASSSADKHEAVRLYVEGTKQFQNYQSQWSRFVVELCISRFQTRGLDLLPEQNRNAFLDEARSVAGTTRQLPLPASEKLTDKLISKNSSDVIEELKFELEKHSLKFVRAMFSHFRTLTNRKIIGAISWADEHSCHFVDWGHFIEATKDGTRKVVSQRTEFRTPGDDDALQWMEETTTTRTSFGSIKHVAVRREQHLMQASRDRVDDYQGAVPRRFNPVIQALPDFIRPFVSVISGECFRNERQPQVLRTSSWETKKVTVRKQVHYDPAATLGTVVLFSWDDHDELVEIEERNSDKQINSGILFLAIAACLALIAATVCVLDLPGKQSQPVLIGLASASGWFFHSSMTAFFRYKRISTDVSEQLPGILGWMACVVGLTLLAQALVSISIWVGLGTGLLAVGCLAFGVVLLGKFLTRLEFQFRDLTGAQQ